MKNVLIDTSIVLDGVENVTMLDKQNNVFVSDVVLRELDGNKGAEGSKGYNAREFFRQFNKNDFKTLDTLPETGMPVMKNDTLTEGSIDSGAHVYTLSRKWYRAKDINDSRIIEIAKDYDLGLVTLDQAQSARAKSVGVAAKMFRTMQEVGQLKGDIFVVVSLIYMMIVFFALMATEYTQEGAIFMSIFPVLVAMFAYLFLANKIALANSKGWIKLTSFISFNLGIVAFIFAEIHGSYLIGTIGFALSIIGSLFASFSEIVFKNLSQRYELHKIQDEDDIPLKSEIGESVTNTMMANVGATYGQSGTVYRL